MNSQELQQALSMLHAELMQTTEMDAAKRQRLTELIAEIHRLVGPLDQPPAPSDAEETSLTHNLQNMVTGFEARHPQLTSTVQQLIDRLAEIGI